MSAGYPAGGRYDGLPEMLSPSSAGPIVSKTPGIGWAAGLERLSLVVSSVFPGLAAANQAPLPRIHIVPVLSKHPLEEEARAVRRRCLIVAQGLRAMGESCVAEWGEPKAAARNARSSGAAKAVYIGSREVEEGGPIVKIKNLATGEEEIITFPL